MKTVAVEILVLASLILMFINASGSHHTPGIPVSDAGEAHEIGISDFVYLLDDDSYMLDGDCKFFCGLMLFE